MAVHGCGGVGLSAIRIASALGASVIAIDLTDEKLAFAKKMGAVATVNARDAADVSRRGRARAPRLPAPQGRRRGLREGVP